jgi:hypothetical protein
MDAAMAAAVDADSFGKMSTKARLGRPPPTSS